MPSRVGGIFLSPFMSHDGLHPPPEQAAITAFLEQLDAIFATEGNPKPASTSLGNGMVGALGTQGVWRCGEVW